MWPICSDEGKEPPYLVIPKPKTFSEAPKGVVTSAELYGRGVVFIALVVWTTAMSSEESSSR